VSPQTNTIVTLASKMTQFGRGRNTVGNRRQCSGCLPEGQTDRPGQGSRIRRQACHDLIGAPESRTRAIRSGPAWV